MVFNCLSACQVSGDLSRRQLELDPAFRVLTSTTLRRAPVSATSWNGAPSGPHRELHARSFVPIIPEYF